uniref:Matrix AAA peptidase interacting protein 1 n=1 Tax=Anas platyrhynchos platyrhynchos TaxID=8840 RepID=U3ILQ2_ANAPP
MQNNFREVTFPQVFPLAPSHTNQLNLRSSALAQQDLKFFFFFIFPPCTGKTNRRSYDTKEGPRRRVVVVRISSPLAWLRSRCYYLLIRLYFDPEFSVEEFTRGAKQAFSVVSQLLSQRKLDLLDGLVSSEVLNVLKEKISLLSDNHRDALAADIDAIMYTTEGDIRIYYNDDGRKFVSILMRFWYLNGANLPDEVPGETKVFQIVFGDESTKEKRHLLTANYEFQREFTEGAKPDWTITRIEHPRLLE